MSIFTRLFGQKKNVETPKKITKEGLYAVAAAYGLALEKHAASGSLVSDESKLPMPKPMLRIALLGLIRLEKDAKQREQLKAAYLMLADFQPGVGTAAVRISGVSTSGDIQAEAARIADEAGEFSKWGAMSLAEMENLKKDLEGL